MNNPWLSFSSDALWPTAIAVGLLILIIIREWLKAITNKRKLINSLVSGLAVVGLLMIWLQPKVTFLKPASSVLLLTDGFEQSHRDSVLRANSFIEELHNDSLSFQQRHELINNRHILMIGNGIPEKELSLWSTAHVDYLPNNDLAGITRLKYNEHHSVGEMLHVRGLYNSITTGKLKLNGFGKALDSVEIISSKQGFVLSTPLKSPGRYVYSISFTDSAGNQSVMGELPVQVQNTNKVKVLMINSFPTFEQKYLKNFLVEEGHQVVVRNQLSKGRYQFEFYNAQRRQRFYNLSLSLLANFDIAVTDYNTFKQLSRQNLNALNRSMENGLGVLILPTEDEFSNRQVNLFKNFTFTKAENDHKTISFQHEEIAVPTYERALKPLKFQYGVLHNLMVYQPVGLGKIATNTLRHGYQLVLNGQEEMYQWLWKKQLEVLKHVIKPPGLVGDRWAFINKPYNFRLHGFSDLDVVEIDSVVVPMEQDPHLPTQWTGTYWPRSDGWHSVSVNQQDTLWFYVQRKNNAWRSLIKTRQVASNQRTFMESIQTKSLREVEIMHKINPIWFYLLFLISVAYLWVEPKIL